MANTHWAQGSPHVTLNNHAKSHGSPQPSGKAWKPEAGHREWFQLHSRMPARQGARAATGMIPGYARQKSQKHTTDPV